MPIPPSINKVLYNDAGNPASYPGTGTLWTDTSGSVDLTLINSPAFESVPGYFDFSGANRSAEGSGFPAITVTGPFSFNTWFKIDGVLGNTFMLIWGTGIGGPGVSTSCGWTVLEYAGNIAMFAKGAAFYANVGSYTIGKWHQFTCTVNASGDTKVYIDGVLTFTQLAGIWGSGSPAGSTCQVGGLASDPSLRLNGDVALIETYDIELTALQVTDLYLSYKNRFAIIASWDASNTASYSGSGNTWFDITGNSIDLTGASSFTYTAKNTTPNPLGWTNPGYFSNATAMRMESVVSNLLKFSTEGTIQGWFYNNNAFGVPLSFPYTGNFPSYWYQVYANKPGFNFLVDSTFRNWDPGGSTINTQWFNWAIVFDNGDADLYINGVYQSTNSQAAFGSSIFYNPANTSLVLGDIDNTGASFPFIGRYGEIVMYSSALSSADILDNYNNTHYKYDGAIAPPGPALVASFDFGNPSSYPGTGTSVTDLTGNGNNLTFTNAPTYNSALGGYVELNSTMSANIGGTFPNNLPFGQSDFSMVIWAQVPSAYNVSMFALGGGNPGGGRVDMGYGFSGSILGTEFYGSAYIQQATTPTPGTWFQYVITGVAGDTTNQLLTYVNGSLDTSTAGGPTPVIDFTNNDTFPGSNPRLSINWQGAPGDMKIIKAEVYNYAISAGDVTTDYAALQARVNPTPPAYVGLVGGRTFGQGFAG